MCLLYTSTENSSREIGYLALDFVTHTDFGVKIEWLPLHLGHGTEFGQQIAGITILTHVQVM